MFNFLTTVWNTIISILTIIIVFIFATLFFTLLAVLIFGAIVVCIVIGAVVLIGCGIYISIENVINWCKKK